MQILLIIHIFNCFNSPVLSTLKAEVFVKTEAKQIDETEFQAEQWHCNDVLHKAQTGRR